MKTPPRPGDLVALDPSECLELLGSAPWARVGFVVDDVPTVLPINILMHDNAIYFRTGAGTKLGSAAAGGVVAIEADGGDEATRVGWSVVVHGQASIVSDPALEETLFSQPFEPWALPDDRLFWVRVAVEAISGRRILHS